MTLGIDENNNSSAAFFSVMKDGPAGSELFRVQEDGYVGIGTAAPAAHLHIEPGGEVNTEIRIVGGIPDNYAWSLLAERMPNLLDIYPQTAGGILTLGQNNSKIGIGTRNPQGKLDIHGSLAAAGVEGTSGQILTSQGPGASPVWSSVSQSKLKTSTGEVNASGQANVTLPGGEYGFYPQIKASGCAGTALVRIAYAPFPTSYTTNIFFDNTGNTTYAQQRYVTSSGKDHWMFFLIDKNTKQVLGGYQAPDHPCYGSGGDENDIPHPFGSYDPDKHEVILADNGILPELKSKVTSKRSLLTIINEEYKIDFDSEPVYQPREIIEIDEYGDKTGEILQKIKTPEWAKILIGKDETYLKRRLVETLPDYISYKKLRLKSEAIVEAPVLSQNTESQPDTR